jgi:hypothetical protein
MAFWSIFMSSCSWSSTPRRVFDHEHEDTNILQNAMNYSRNDTVSHPQRLWSSAVLLWEHQILHPNIKLNKIWLLFRTSGTHLYRRKKHHCWDLERLRVMSIETAVFVDVMQCGLVHSSYQSCLPDVMYHFSPFTQIWDIVLCQHLQGGIEENWKNLVSE